MDWTQLNPEEAAIFISQVEDKSEPALFTPALCDVHTLPVSFYDGYSLYRIVNRHMMPYLLLDYLSNGENHYYLDGSETPFHNLNSRGALSLDDNNVIDYLDLYVSYVYERGNSLGFVRTPNGLGAQVLNTDENSFEIKAPLNYKNRDIEAKIRIEHGGAIHIEDPLQVSFLDNITPGTNIGYRHPQEEKIITESKALLGETETGRRLLKKGEECNAQIRVLNSPNYQGYVTNNLTIYMLMPAAEQTAKYLQALILAYCLRDAEQVSQGFARAPYGEDKEQFTNTNYIKNLDMIAEMCKIVSEYEEQGVPEGVLELDAMALSQVYAAFKNHAEAGDLMQIYLTSLEQEGLLS